MKNGFIAKPGWEYKSLFFLSKTELPNTSKCRAKIDALTRTYLIIEA